MLAAALLVSGPLRAADDGGAPRGPIEVRYITPADDIGLENVDRVGSDPSSGNLLVAGQGGARRIVGGGRPATAVSTSVVASPEPERLPSGLAVKDSTVAANGDLYAIVAPTGDIVRTTADGSILDRYDAGTLGLVNPTAIALAPTRDATDAPTAMSLYVADTGLASVVELAAAGPVVVAATSETAMLRATVDTTTGTWSGYFSPDPSDIAYWPAADRLIVVDGEVEEVAINGYPYPGANVYESTRGGAQTGAWDATGFTNEPVGAAFDTASGKLYISEDTGNKIYEIDPVDGTFGNSNDVRRSWATATLYGATDVEGVAIGGNALWIVDGSNGEVYRVRTGPDAKFGTTDDITNQFDIGQYGFTDAEGIEYTPAGTLLIASTTPSKGIIEVTTTGQLLRNIALPSGLGAKKPSGLTLAPASSASGTSLYMTDRGLDNSAATPSPVDGRFYELGIGPTPPLPTPTATPVPTGTPTPTATPTPTPTPSANPFTDINSSQFKNDILYIYNAGITGGCTSTTYCPTNNVLRDQMASFLVRALKLPPTSVDYFDDDEGNQHENQINALAQAGVTGGCGVRRYCPDSPVKRDQMASFLVRAFKLPPTIVNFFSDDNGNQHENQINALANSGITGGCGPGRYCPSGLVTRGQMAAFLHRALE